MKGIMKEGEKKKEQERGRMREKTERAMSKL